MLVSGSISLLNYFRKRQPEDNGIFLPKLESASGELASDAIACANSCVAEAAACANSRVAEVGSKPKRRKTTQHTYSAEVRASIGKYASLHGPIAAVKHFSTICRHTVPESTVRKFRDAYCRELKTQSSSSSGPISVTSLPCKPKGRPLLLGDLDSVVKQYILELRAAGGIINVDVAVAAARGIVESKNRSFLQEYGGNITIDRPWAKSLLTRMNFVKHKGSTAAKLPISEF